MVAPFLAKQAWRKTGRRFRVTSALRLVYVGKMIRKAMKHFGLFLVRFSGIIGPALLMIPIFLLTNMAWQNGHTGIASMVSSWLFGH